MDSILESVARVRESIDRAARASGRTGSDITLVAAAKQNSADAVRAAVAAGVDAVGENRVQELLEKDALGAYEGTSLHFIGRVQSNKLSKLVGRVSLIQSADSIEALRTIDRLAAGKGLVQDILLEVNIAGEGTKGGFSHEAVSDILPEARRLTSVRVRGLMAIPPFVADPEDNVPYFRQMRSLFERHVFPGFDILSMGMSGDFEAAVREGASMVRVGSSIFGQRTY